MISRHPTGPADVMILPDDVACTGIPADPPSPNPSFMTGICHAHPPPSSHLDDHLASLASSTPHTMAITWDRVQPATTCDKDMIQLISFIKSGFPKFQLELPQALQVYHQFQEHLYTVDGVILYKDCIVMPPSPRTSTSAQTLV